MASQNIRLFADTDAITPSSLNERIKALAGCSYAADAPTAPLDYQLWVDSDASPRTLNIWIPSTGWVSINADVTTADLSDTSYLALTGGTMTGAIAMGTSKITGVGNATAAQDAMTKANYDARKKASGTTIDGIAATGNWPLFVGPEASCVISDVIIVSDTATTASDGTNNYTFQVRNITQSLDLRAAVKSTNGAEIGLKIAYALGLDQNLTIAANDVLEFQVVKNAAPTALTTARIIVQVNFKLTI